MSNNRPNTKTSQAPQKRAKSPVAAQFDFGIKFLRFHLDLSLDDDYLERRANETVRSKRSDSAGPRHS